MNIAPTENPTPQKPLRLWPGVAAVAVLWLGWLAVPLLMPGAALYGMIGALAGAVAVLLWWLLFSRAPWVERVGAIVLMVVGTIAARPFLHESIRTGMMGFMFYLYVVPVLCLALVVWALASRGLSAVLRRVSLVAGIGLACGGFWLLRTGGMTGEGDSDLHWRWRRTPEQRLLAAAEAPTPVAPPAETVSMRPSQPTEPSPDPPAPQPAADWPGFRGPGRDSVVLGIRIATNWADSPPVELWRRPVGPGWSSFAVHGDLIYTQEQRGEDEVVSCYSRITGKPVWMHRDAARFWESNAGAGPRATPFLSKGRVYSFGATGILNSLDALTGSVVWTRNVSADTESKTPMWGFAGSPLVAGETVIVAAAGTLAAYDIASGNPRWFGPRSGSGYSSPHWITIGGVEQIALLNGSGAISVSPADGRLLWKYAWPGDGIVQPAQFAGDLLIGTGSGLGSGAGMGVRRVAVTQGSGGWTAEERWTSTGLKPYYNDFVVHNGHAYGFDGSILACIDLNDGKRKWKGGRFGHGQLVLLPEQDLLIVLSEQGELGLVKATPDQFTELARLQTIEGKTWNHPVLAGDILLVRNGEEMAAFRLPLAGR
jgi:outer membrane protein assembly factor BamB